MNDTKNRFKTRSFRLPITRGKYIEPSPALDLYYKQTSVNEGLGEINELSVHYLMCGVRRVGENSDVILIIATSRVDRGQDKRADFKWDRFWKRDKTADFENETKPSISKMR